MTIFFFQKIDRYGLPVRTVLNSKTGLIRTDPYYSTEWLNSFYESDYRPLYTNSDLIPKSLFFSEQIRFGYEIFKMVAKHLKADARVCEIGCGMGGLLVPFKLEGFEVEGIDLGEEFLQVGKDFNINIQKGDVNTLLDKGAKYDLIIINHVLEHIPEINDFIGKIKSLLNENGLLYVAVPGIMTISTSYNFDFLMYLQNAHCWHFSRKSLTILLNLNGFEVLESDESIKCLAHKSDREIKPNSMENDWKEVIKVLKKNERIRSLRLQKVSNLQGKIHRKLSNIPFFKKVFMRHSA